MPPNGTAGLARSRVKGSRRDPRPPANTMANTSRYTRKPPLDVSLGNRKIHGHRGLLTIVHGNVRQANGFARRNPCGSGAFWPRSAEAHRLGCFISSRLLVKSSWNAAISIGVRGVNRWPVAGKNANVLIFWGGQRVMAGLADAWRSMTLAGRSGMFSRGPSLARWSDLV